MKIGFQANASYNAKKKRIGMIPKITRDMFMSAFKSDACTMNKLFQEGIRNNNFSLKPLHKKTIAAKEEAGYSRPENPLYGKGDEQARNSYMKMIRMEKLDDGFRVYPSQQKHWSREATLFQLFSLHEFGGITTIGGSLVRIPPRPAFHLAYERTLQRRNMNRKVRQMRKAISKYVRTGSAAPITVTKESFMKGLKSFENFSR